MTETLTAVQAFERVKNSVKPLDDQFTLRFSEAAQAGDVIRQGDILITKLDKIPDGYEQQEKFSLQLAEGDTKGARHCLDNNRGVALYKNPDADVLTGPAINLTEERTVEHPEHGHICLPPGSYSITFQRSFAEELRRVAD